MGELEADSGGDLPVAVCRVALQVAERGCMLAILHVVSSRLGAGVMPSTVPGRFFS
jgi:hypothetical protein